MGIALLQIHVWDTARFGPVHQDTNSLRYLHWSQNTIMVFLATLERVVESVNTRCAAVVEQKTAVVAEIHTAMAHLRQALEVRETELVGQAEQMAQQKLKTLAAQRDGFELQLGQLRNCQDFVEESRRTCSQGEILRMKSPLVKQVNDLTSSFKPETLALAEQVDMRFAHNLPELVKTCQQFGKVYCSQVVPEKCRASGEGIKVAMRGQMQWPSL